MTFVILGECSTKKASECVTVYPSDCIEEGPNQLYIMLVPCIDYGAYVAVCPVDAIVVEYDLIAGQGVFLEVVERFFP